MKNESENQDRSKALKKKIKKIQIPIKNADGTRGTNNEAAHPE